ncbi:S1 family peptidase [Nocardiopsis sp. N85]|uniref:S1 family peptidase n=1 Tax=Nocardiopsis sp. N85 TaxID=3029400 RepID=UPI00237EFBA0|nr:S1 family peptidase [Nocardiopsis sp. N85]MDE3723602.1 S1 family peptidase [Nocardiopsis sp. N85]
MKYPPVLAALGLVAAVLAAPAPATAAPSPAEPVADDPVAALVRDMDLTETEAHDLLAAQAVAGEIDAEAADIAGDAYAGSSFDIDTHALTVLVTDSGVASAVEAAGAEVVVIDTDPADTVRALDAAAVPEGVVGWYPDSDTVVVEVMAGSGIDAGDLGVPDDAVRLVETDTRPRTYGQIIGGRPFVVNGVRCTIGFSATGGRDARGFLTAGHCGRVGQVLQGPDGPVGVFQHSVFPGRDGAFVRVYDPWRVTNLVDRYDGTFVRVTGSNPAPVGSALCLSSSTHGWRCGTLQARDQTVTYPQGSVQGLFRSTLCAGPGDSGAPIVAGSQAQGIVSGGSGSPGTGCTTFGQEVNPLLSLWGLTLVTS